MKLRNNIIQGALQTISAPSKHLKILSSALLTSACLLAISTTTAHANLSSDLEGAGWTVHNADLVDNLTGNGDAVTLEQMDFDADDLTSGYGLANGLMSTSGGMLMMSPTTTVSDASLYDFNQSWSSDLGPIYQYDLANDIENAYPAADGNYVNVNMKLISSEVATLDGSDAQSVINIGDGISIVAPETFTYKTSDDPDYREYAFEVQNNITSSSSNLPSALDTNATDIKLLNKDGDAIGVGSVENINGTKTLNITPNAGVSNDQTKALSNTLSYVDGDGNAQTFVQGSPESYEMRLVNNSYGVDVDIDKYPYLYVVNNHDYTKADVIGEAKLTREGYISVSEFYDGNTKEDIGLKNQWSNDFAAVLQCETPNCNINSSNVKKVHLEDGLVAFTYREPVIESAPVEAYDGSLITDAMPGRNIDVIDANNEYKVHAVLTQRPDGTLALERFQHGNTIETIKAGLGDDSMEIRYINNRWGFSYPDTNLNLIEGYATETAFLGELPSYPAGQGVPLNFTGGTELVTSPITGHSGMMLPAVMLINPDGSKDARWGSDAAVQYDAATQSYSLITDSANYVGGSGEYSLVLDAVIETVHAEKSLNLYGSAPGMASTSGSSGETAAGLDAIVHNASWDQLAQSLGIELDNWVTGLSEVENKTEEQVQSQLSDLEESITACVTKIGTDLNSSGSGIGNYQCETIAATSKIEKACWVDSREQKALWIAFDEDSFVTIRERFLLLIPNQVDNGGNITYSFGVNELACLTNAQNSSFSLSQGENNELMGSIIGEGQKCAYTELDALGIDSPFETRQDDGTLACEE